MTAPVPADPTQVMRRRVLATLIDAALVIVPAIAVVTSSFEYLPEERLDRSGEEFCDAYLAGGGTRFCLDMTDVDNRVYFADGVPNAGTAIFWGGTILLLVVLQGFTGWTPGKLVTGIRTVGEDGRPPGFGRALVRWALWVLDGFPYLLPLVGFITALTTVGHRRVGDMAAKTFVIRASAAGSPVVVPGLTAPPPPAGYVPGVPWGTTTPPGGPGWDEGSSDPAWSAPQPPYPQNPPPPSGPQWDEARGTYIQWDPNQGAWLQWDEPTRVWIRIPGQ